MRRARYAMLVFLGLLLSTSGFADDASDSSTKVKLSPLVAFYVQALDSESEFNSRWQPFYRVETMAVTDFASQPIVNLNFEDSGAFARVKKIRALSLLTLAEAKGTRLFLGVNRNGLIGIHLRAVASYDDERCLEVARMPYLTSTKPLTFDR